MCPCGGEGMPLYSDPFPSLVEISQDIPGLNLFLQDKSYCRSLCGFPNFYFHFRAGGQLQGGGGRSSKQPRQGCSTLKQAADPLHSCHSL